MQTAAALEELTTTGRLLPDPARACEDFAEAYGWMLEQMDLRLPTRGASALWFWAKIRRADLIDPIRYSRGDVLLTCRIRRAQVLPSHFNDWHQVLNGFPNVFLLPGESYDAYGDRLDAILDDLGSRAAMAGAGSKLVWDWPDDLRREVQDTWLTIFDPANDERAACWQATTHELRAEDVLEAVWIER
jgi:hypothetical protein